MRRIFHALVFGVLLMPPGGLGAQEATPAASAWTRVTYISGGTVYVDAGTRAGLRQGASLEVVRSGGREVIARLVVDFISSTRAACSVAQATGEIAVGDSVRFSAIVPAAPALRATGDSQAATPARRRNPVHGRVGLRYTMVDPGGGRPSWTQPAVDLRLDGQQIGGSPLGASIDVRAYRPRAGATGRGSAASTRVYQARLDLGDPQGRVHFAAGRQLSQAIAGMGIFDGVTVDGRGRHASAGVVAGTQPDAASFGMSGLVREYGAWIQAHNAPGARAPWTFTLAGVGSYDRGNINREYASLQGTVTARRVSVFVTQEVDLNRGWKATLEGTSATPTSSFAMLRVTPVDAVTLHAGYDNRRSVRLYRDFLDPEAEFDDAFRQGAWAGLSLNAGSHLRISTDARQSRGAHGAGADARSLTGSLAIMRLTPLGLGLNARGTDYTGSAGDGALVSASVEMNPWNRFHVDVGGGRRSDRRSLDGSRAPQLDWREINGDVAIGRSLFLLVTTYEERGGFGRSRQAFVSLSWRFRGG